MWRICMWRAVLFYIRLNGINVQYFEYDSRFYDFITLCYQLSNIPNAAVNAC